MIFIFPTDTCFGMACALADATSYHAIYKIKQRPIEKPLAILVPNISWLAQNTELTTEQIDFLQKYPFPWTVIASSKFLDGKSLVQKNHQGKYAFRVAHHPVHDTIMQYTGLLFLTSANISGEKEIYTASGIFSKFRAQIYAGEMTLWGDTDAILEKNPPSDIFSFEENTTNQVFIRNYQ